MRQEEQFDHNSLIKKIENLNAVINSIPDTMVILDKLGTYIEHYRSFDESHGLLDKSILGLSVYDVYDIKTAEIHLRNIQFALQFKEPITYEYPLEKNGITSFYEVRAIALSDNSILQIIRNITNRRIAEQEIQDLNSSLEIKMEGRASELEEARKEAESANLAKSEFLSRMSHELRTPMNSILGFAQLLNMGELNKGQQKGVNHILKSGNHLLDLINEILDISRIEAGRMALSFQSIQMKSVIEEIIDTIKPIANERHITIEFINTDENLLYVNADFKRLKQILINLLNNAVKYNNKNGFIYIECDLRINKETGENFLRTSIRDTGIGIDEEDIPKLFNAFERIKAEGTRVEGTGLGLALVKKLVEIMDGRVGVSSRPIKGSTFWFELPLVENQSLELEENFERLSTVITPIIKTGRIIYIEDNLPNLELVTGILEIHRPNIELLTSRFGNYAVNLSTVHKPDLILLDLDLPDIYGGEVLKNLKADLNTKSIPVVIVSADAMPKKIEHLMQSGASEYLTKPLDVALFLRTIDQWISTKNEKS
ncbi:MAG: ATP-binding protein [Bacteroidales bacterium]|nr:ATP-binding protein [Bacteroidales bacterium]